MSAAAIVELMGGGAKTAINAAAMALQGLLGLACDPVADRVEVPCLNKNILAGTNALSCANMALAGYRNVIPFDETVSAMKDVYGRMPAELRCTGLGGLSLSKTAADIYKQLNP
jgi:L-serine dehydratase